MEALAPYQPLAMKVLQLVITTIIVPYLIQLNQGHCFGIVFLQAFFSPIDTSLSFSQANILIKELKPLHLVVPETYTIPPVSMPHRADLVIETVSMVIQKL